jgi:hypothetical protein
VVVEGLLSGHLLALRRHVVVIAGVLVAARLARAEVRRLARDWHTHAAGVHGVAEAHLGLLSRAGHMVLLKTGSIELPDWLFDKARGRLDVAAEEAGPRACSSLLELVKDLLLVASAVLGPCHAVGKEAMVLVREVARVDWVVLVNVHLLVQFLITLLILARIWP